MACKLNSFFLPWIIKDFRDSTQSTCVTTQCSLNPPFTQFNMVGGRLRGSLRHSGRARKHSKNRPVSVNAGKSLLITFHTLRLTIPFLLLTSVPVLLELGHLAPTAGGG